MVTPETIEIVCRCAAEFKVRYQRQAADDEVENFQCPNCYEPYSVHACTPVVHNDFTITKKGIELQLQDLDAREVLKVLSDKKVEFLYHANTVGTACTFLEQNALLSREQVEKGGLFQTEQYTDDSDKAFSIYNDVFLDFVDIHARINDINLYGPVLFQFPINILGTNNINFVRITKINPDKWSNEDQLEGRYFTSIEEFSKGYHVGDFGSMMMLPYVNGRLQLAGHLTEILLDNPTLVWRDTNIRLEQEAFKKLKTAYKVGKLNGIKYNARTCTKENCGCYNTYSKDVNSTKFFRQLKA